MNVLCNFLGKNLDKNSAKPFAETNVMILKIFSPKNTML
jgi:hypothetical protein